MIDFVAVRRSFRIAFASQWPEKCEWSAIGAHIHKSSLIGAGFTSVRYAPVATKFRIAAT
jgi:hypothetical protein